MLKVSSVAKMRDTRDEEGPRVPLKTILQNFLNHVENLEARVREGDDAYEKEFQALKSLSESLRSQSEYSCSEGEKEVNRKKNRYKDILPFDHNRIQLSEYPGVPGSDYINASYIKGASGSNAYIACQGPLPHTVNDFWRLVVETEVQVIVMACNEQEGGKHKCERYWSEEPDVECQFGKYFVRLLKSREICPDFLVRTMRLRWTSEGDDKIEEERTVCQFHYSLWPDHGIPTQVRPLLEMVRLIRDCQASETLPVLIHCSAGCGRTGTVCAIDFIWGLLRTGKLTSDFSLYNLVKDMRKQRIAMVQTLEQYVLVHRAVKELFLEQLRVIDSHPYENVDDDGHPLVDNKEDTDYETVVVNNSDDKIQDHEVRSEVMDQVLSQRMQNRPLMGTAMLSSASSKSSSEMSSMLSNFDSLERPPQPPPKQRYLDSNKIDNTTIDTSKLEPMSEAKQETAIDIAAEFNKTNANLFEPPGGNNNKAEPQKFKKGNLKLTQDDKGNWKIEENLEPTNNVVVAPPSMPENNNKVAKKSSPKSKKSSSKETSDTSENSMLLRRPSIKKIKAFFQQQKEASADLVSEAVSKLPTLGSAESKSVPSSLDRKYSTASASKCSDENQTSSLEKRPTLRPQGPRQPLKSVSSERLLLATDQQQQEKPSLPIKRSKSMKTIQKDDVEDLSFGFEAMNTKVAALRSQVPPPKPKRSLTHHDAESIKVHLSNYSRGSPNHSRQSSMEAERPSMSHLVMASFDLAEREASKISSDYVNVNVHDGHMYALAQRKLSEASMLPKSRERRNSFREAVEKSDAKSYEPIWFEQGGNGSESSPIYANVGKRASPVRKVSAELTSVSLVSEINKGLNKQNSNSSLTSSISGQSLNNGKGLPPPYVQPPQPQRGTAGGQRPSLVGKVPTSNAATYANVQYRVKDSGEALHKSVTPIRFGGVGGEASSSDFDVDVDAIAATMQGQQAKGKFRN